MNFICNPMFKRKELVYDEKDFFTGAKKVATLALAAVIAFQGSNLVKAEDYVGGYTEASDVGKWLSANGDYVYPLTPKDPEWKEIEDYLDKVKACKIPQAILENLSDEQLVQAIIDYPLIYDVFFFSDVNKGVEHLAKTCDAFAELLKRERAKDVLFDAIISRVTDESIEVIAEIEKDDSESAPKSARDEIVFDTLVAITIFQEKIGSELSDEELIVLADVSDKVNVCAPMTLLPGKLTYGIMKTPNGLDVRYLFTECYHTEKQH